MSNDNYIIDAPLPASQDFRLLKEKGLEFIRENGGYAWTNLNASDPGVTILEQVCYALTELGYCNEFAVGDILAGPNGDLNINDNFYLPGKILTTSPVTIEDYKKYIIDSIGHVDHVIIFPVQGSVVDLYQVYLLISEEITTENEKLDICMSTTYALNKCRNLNEFFLPVSFLKRVSFFVTGQIELYQEADRNEVLSGLRLIAPLVYDRSSIGNNILRTSELVNIIKAIPGVKAVSILGFSDTTTALTLNSALTAEPGEVISVNLLQSVKEQLLKINSMDDRLSAGFDNNLQAIGMNDLKPVLPEVSYRDINKYYSIQNCFPEIFAVGANAVTSNATDFQIARSRQLKGYLTLFDQLLANQFSQLANIGRLFSFKNSMTGAPAEVERFYATKDDFEKHHPEYPVPYLNFSPTYFYQSLYDIPHIKPLLKDHDVFMFDTELLPAKLQEQKGWDAYKQYPYNAYIRGLMGCMEDEETGLKRRNDILDQLLARHGESPMLIDLLMEGSRYSGDRLKDQVIFKSLFLQNLGLLSYYRMKGYNFIGANKIPETGLVMPENIDQYFKDTYNKDFIFNAQLVDEMEKLSEQDFINFSAIELKLSLLFGLKPLYRDCILKRLNPEKRSGQDPVKNIWEIIVALWMSLERKGMIFIETGLLLQFFEHGNMPLSVAGPPQLTGNNLVLIFPDFIHEHSRDTFKTRVELFLGHAVPATATYHVCFANAGSFLEIIPAFIKWHNSLIYREPLLLNDQINENAQALINILNETHWS